MQHSIYYIVCCCYVTALSLLFPLTSHAAEEVFSSTASDMKTLFSPGGPTGAIIRERTVTMNAHLLFTQKVAGPLDAEAPLVFNLFDDVSIMATPHRMESYINGTLVWVGKIPGDPLGAAVLGETNGVIMGNVRTGGGDIYEIRHAGEDVYVVREIDINLLPPNLPPIRPSKEALASVAPYSSDPDIEPDDGSIITIGVAYTSAARASVGSTSAMDSLIATTVSEQNIGYENSGVIQRVSLTASGEVSYTETSGGQESALDSLQNPSDGVMDGVVTARNNNNIDLISLWMVDSSACGLAYAFEAGDTNFAEYAYSTAAVDCVAEYTMAHEMGHNQGCAHDRANASGQGYYSYSYGYQNTANSPTFHTIMAYDCSPSCTRINYWANPDVSYQGNATGVDENAANSANTVLTLNNLRVTVANFRVSGDSGGGSDTPTYTAPLFSFKTLLLFYSPLLLFTAIHLLRRKKPE